MLHQGPFFREQVIQEHEHKNGNSLLLDMVVYPLIFALGGRKRVVFGSPSDFVFLFIILRLMLYHPKNNND